jgi:hypothetical protein
MRIPTSLGLVCGLSVVVGCGRDQAAAPDTQAAPASAAYAAMETETYDDPTFKLWANYPVGTTVVHKQTTENENNPKKTVTTIRYVLRAKTADSLSYEFQATTHNWDGHVQTNPAQRFEVNRTNTRPKGAGATAQKGHVGAGEETLTVLGRSYKTKWQTHTEFTDAGELTATNWSSADIPGGLVKSVSKISNTKSQITVEVVEVNIPKG